MIPIWLGIFIIIASMAITILFMKGVFIWRDAMLKRNQIRKEYLKRLRK
jgi:hypothetical protein